MRILRGKSLWDEKGSQREILAVHKSNWHTPEGGKKKPELRGEWKKLKDHSGGFCRSRGDSVNRKLAGTKPKARAHLQWYK